MSATGRGAERRPDDFYETPAWCVRRLLEAVVLPSGKWLEPCAGTGAIVRAVMESRQERWTTVELDGRGERCVQWVASSRVWADVDFLGWVFADGLHDGRYDVAITNPPFSLAREFIDACLPIADHVVMLLRLNFLEGKERHDLFTATHPDVYVLPNRPSFTGNGTDATAYAWFHWHAGAAGIIRVLGLTPLAERK